jgi:WD40 repeat protein
MNRPEKRLTTFLAVGLITLGPNPSVAGDGPGRTGGEVKLSPSLGTDRPLEFLRVSSVKLSCDGRRVVAATRGAFYAWDSNTGRRLLQVETDTRQRFLGNIDLDEAGRRIVTGDMLDYGFDHGPIRAHRVLQSSLADLWDADSGRLARSFVLHERRSIGCAAISRNGNRVAGADDSLSAKLWDADTGREISSVEGTNHALRGLGITFSGDATRFAAVTNDHLQPGDQGAIHLGDLAARRTRTIGPLPDKGFVYGAVAINSDGREVVAWLGDVDECELLGRPRNATGRELAIFDFDTGALRARLPGPACKDISYLAFSPDGKTIALGKEDGHLDLVDRASGSRVAELRVSDGPVRAVAFLPDRVRIVAEREFVTNATRSGGAYAGPLRIADFRVRLTP